MVFAHTSLQSIAHCPSSTKQPPSGSWRDWKAAASSSVMQLLHPRSIHTTMLTLFTTSHLSCSRLQSSGTQRWFLSAREVQTPPLPLHGKTSFPSAPRAAFEPRVRSSHLPYSTILKLPSKGQRALPACSSPPSSIRMCRARSSMCSWWSLMTSLPEERERGGLSRQEPWVLLERNPEKVPCTPFL